MARKNHGFSQSPLRPRRELRKKRLSCSLPQILYLGLGRKRIKKEKRGDEFHCLPFPYRESGVTRYPGNFPSFASGENKEVGSWYKVGT